jgi:hypothetical protein
VYNRSARLNRMLEITYSSQFQVSKSFPARLVSMLTAGSMSVEFGHKVDRVSNCSLYYVKL